MDNGAETGAWMSVEVIELSRIARWGNCPFHPPRETPRGIQSAQMKQENT